MNMHLLSLSTFLSLLLFGTTSIHATKQLTNDEINEIGRLQRKTIKATYLQNKKVTLTSIHNRIKWGNKTYQIYRFLENSQEDYKKRVRAGKALPISYIDSPVDGEQRILVEAQRTLHQALSTMNPQEKKALIMKLFADVTNEPLLEKIYLSSTNIQVSNRNQPLYYGWKPQRWQPYQTKESLAQTIIETLFQEELATWYKMFDLLLSPQREDDYYTPFFFKDTDTRNDFEYPWKRVKEKGKGKAVILFIEKLSKYCQDNNLPLSQTLHEFEQELLYREMVTTDRLLPGLYHFTPQQRRPYNTTSFYPDAKGNSIFEALLYNHHGIQLSTPQQAILQACQINGNTSVAKEIKMDEKIQAIKKTAQTGNFEKEVNNNLGPQKGAQANVWDQDLAKKIHREISISVDLEGMAWFEEQAKFLQKNNLYSGLSNLKKKVVINIFKEKNRQYIHRRYHQILFSYKQQLNDNQLQSLKIPIFYKPLIFNKVTLFDNKPLLIGQKSIKEWAIDLTADLQVLENENLNLSVAELKGITDVITQQIGASIQSQIHQLDIKSKDIKSQVMNHIELLNQLRHTLDLDFFKKNTQPAQAIRESLPKSQQMIKQKTSPFLKENFARFIKEPSNEPIIFSIADWLTSLEKEERKDYIAQTIQTFKKEKYTLIQEKAKEYLTEKGFVTAADYNDKIAYFSEKGLVQRNLMIPKKAFEALSRFRSMELSEIAQEAASLFRSIQGMCNVLNAIKPEMRNSVEQKILQDIEKKIEEKKNIDASKIIQAFNKSLAKAKFKNQTPQLINGIKQKFNTWKSSQIKAKIKQVENDIKDWQGPKKGNNVGNAYQYLKGLKRTFVLKIFLQPKEEATKMLNRYHLFVFKTYKDELTDKQREELYLEEIYYEPSQYALFTLPLKKMGILRDWSWLSFSCCL